ncbi:DNA cytosine methyltransferase [Glutamicibacter sp. NPDC087673]|uniref:DNA cytosine methyltransferase n=1 Tax=Glutamicibacter sp. NPDC087673 TaxID=3363997 RepID=UPI0037F92157
MKNLGSIDKYKVVDFFSGCGGTSSGFEAAGFEILAGIDNDPSAATTFRQNFPDALFLEKDINDLMVDEVKAIVGVPERTLFAGCAPCQPFSKQQQYSDSSDPRRGLLLHFLKFIQGIKPAFVFVENVPGIQKADLDNGPFALFVRGLLDNGYNIEYRVVKSSDFGVPQTRKRLMLMASLYTEISIPQPTHGDLLQPLVTVRDAIGSLPPIAAGEQCEDDPDHQSANLSQKNLERIKATAEGKGRESWPEELMLECHRTHLGHSDVYGRLAWDRLASGLTTKCISYSNGRFGHPEQDRALSVREAALLQTFPPTFRFFGGISHKAKQVGNAVPPLLAQRVGEAFLKSAASKT